MVVLDILFGVLASIIVAWFSRQREFRADAGSAKLEGGPRKMISALQRLGGLHPEPLPSNMASLGIAGKGGVMSLFATHPSIEERSRDVPEARYAARPRAAAKAHESAAFR